MKLSSSVMLSSPVIPRLTIVSSITRSTSSAAIFFDHTQSDQSRRSNAPLVEKQFDQTDWKPKSREPSVELTKRDIDIWYTQREPDRLVPDFGDPGKLRHQQRL